MKIDRILHLSRPHFESGGDDHVLLPVQEIDPSFVVHCAHISGEKPAFTNGMSGFFSFVPVPRNNTRSSDGQLTDFSRGKLFLEITQVHNLCFMTRDGNPNGDGSGRGIYGSSQSQRDQSGRRGAFGQSIDIVNIGSGKFLKSFYDSRNYRSSAAVNFSEG